MFYAHDFDKFTLVMALCISSYQGHKKIIGGLEFRKVNICLCEIKMYTVLFKKVVNYTLENNYTDKYV